MQQTSGCPSCGSPIVPGQRFCGVCGTTINTGCPYCGAALNPGARFCANCGAPAGEVQQAAPPPPQQPGWGQQPPQQPGWGQQPPPQQPGWSQQPSPPQQPGWGQQQPGWGQQPPPQQPGWGRQPSTGQAQPRSPFLLVTLVALIICLGFFSYWAFASPAWLPPLFGANGSNGADTTPPIISSIASNTTATSATVTWDTDELASDQVEYGTDTAYGSSTTVENDPTTDTSIGVLTHSVTITGLTPGTEYHYRVKSKDKDGNETVSEDKTFTTAAAQ